MATPTAQQPAKNGEIIDEAARPQDAGITTTVKGNLCLPNVPEDYFFHSKVHIEEGDFVIVFMTRESLQAITVTRGQMYHNKWGKYSHDDMIGRKYGSKASIADLFFDADKRTKSFQKQMTSPPPQPGYVHLLRPTPELWTLSLPHRTQIVYLPDISFITNELRVRPGSRVIEAGTGSGSMSHSLARTIGFGEGSGEEWKSGPKLFSFEYHATRYEKALEEFQEHGLSSTIRLRHRNVCKDGFGEEPSDIDAVFLDLPAPWEAIPHVIKTLRVTRTVAALDSEGFVAEDHGYHRLTQGKSHANADIQMFEVLAKPIEVTLPQPEFQTVSSISAKLRRQEIRKEQRRRYQVESSKKRKLTDAAIDVDAEPSAKDADQDMENVSKRAKTIASDKATETSSAAHDRSMPSEKSELGKMLDEVEDEEEEWCLDPNTLNFKPVIDVRGHTSYLTFATMYPSAVRQQLNERDQHKREAVMKRTAELAGLPLQRAGGAAAVGAAISSAMAPNSLPWPSQATSKGSAEFNTSYTRGVDEREHPPLDLSTKMGTDIPPSDIPVIAELPSQPFPDASAHPPSSH
ncbi:hypothetical protein QFC21_001851 [Naganishia friedmannii]|uniref:Uncharacterized protein n=1 Tax=Naganishia friedmannii TaxID=89922 RepID=A0ACC2W2Z6_9TREE|nr:hypothetical protein QFC21_001851 [Naganishia friedmannii]